VTQARLIAFLGAGLCLAAGARAEPPLARLATTLAAEIARVAGDRAVELGPIQDRTGRGAAFALDLRSLVLERLGPRARRSQEGAEPRVRIESVLTETPHRLIVSARVVADPGGRLLDVLSASLPTDSALLALAPMPSRSVPGVIHVVGSARTPPLDAAILDLALVSDERLLVLAPDAIALYRLDGSSLAQEARRALPGPLETVRTPGGLLAIQGDGAWALTSCAPRATFFAIEGGRRLVEREQTASLRLPGSPEGVRYRPGTNLLEGAVAGLGTGPFLALDPALPAVALGAGGQLLLAGDTPRDTGARAGPALTALWPAVLAAASAAPPTGTDSIQLFERREAGLEPLDAIPVPGHVRALAGTARGASARLLAAVEDKTGVYLLLLDLRRGEP